MVSVIIILHKVNDNLNTIYHKRAKEKKAKDKAKAEFADFTFQGAQ